MDTNVLGTKWLTNPFSFSVNTLDLGLSCKFCSHGKLLRVEYRVCYHATPAYGKTAPLTGEMTMDWEESK